MSNRAKEQYVLSSDLFDKNGRLKSYKRAVSALLLAAEHDNAFAQNLLGYGYMEGKLGPKDLRLSIFWFERAAAAGFTEALGNLALMHEHGRGVPRDRTKAIGYYSQAAERGDPWAQSNLGVMYLEGQGVPQDVKKGIALIQEAAAANDAKALYNLGLAFEEGEGVARSLSKAKANMRKAAALGNRKASRWLAAHPTKPVVAIETGRRMHPERKPLLGALDRLVG